MRSILWADRLYLFRHRHEVISLDNILHLTRGKPLSLTHLLFAIHPTDHLYTGVNPSSDGQERCIAQIYQSAKMCSAHINYLLSPTGMDEHCLVPLLEELVKQAGNWGAKQVVADLCSDSPFFSQFRQTGFSVLIRQNVYRYPKTEKPIDRACGNWRTWSSADIQSMRNLYRALVPPLVQPVEPLTRQEMLGLVYYDHRGDLQAYADLVYGPTGVWVLPVVHPQAAADMSELLTQMLHALPDPYRRPVYIAARSYQPWLENALGNLAGEAFLKQALLVCYMAKRQRVKAELSYPVVENGNREPTLPIAPIGNCQD